MAHTITYTDAHALDTHTLWDATHSALLGGRWGEARGCLDALGQRGGFSDKLCTLDTYIAQAGEQGKQLTHHHAWELRTALADRINDINWRCERRDQGY